MDTITFMVYNPIVIQRLDCTDKGQFPNDFASFYIHSDDFSIASINRDYHHRTEINDTYQISNINAKFENGQWTITMDKKGDIFHVHERDWRDNGCGGKVLGNWGSTVVGKQREMVMNGFRDYCMDVNGKQRKRNLFDHA